MHLDINLLHDCQNVGFRRRKSIWQAVIAERQARRRKKRLVGLAALGMWLVAFLIIAGPNLAGVMYSLVPGMTESFAQALGSDVETKKSAFGEVVYEKPEYVPAYDSSLPEGNWIMIDSIGLNSQIREAPREEIESALELGVWRTPEGGSPIDRSFPMVLAAHRFGYLKWTNAYRRENSFFNLPKLEVGDRVEVSWNRRKYVYEIFEGYTDTEIRDLEADLILYTCEVLNSDRRIVRKARLVLPDDWEDNGVYSGFGQVVAYK